MENVRPVQWLDVWASYDDTLPHCKALHEMDNMLICPCQIHNYMGKKNNKNKTKANSIALSPGILCFIASVPY